MDLEAEDEYVSGMSGATRTRARIVQRNYAAEGDTITQLGLDAQQRMETRRKAMMEARDLRLKQVQQEQREQALKESGLHREGSAGSEDARGSGRDARPSVARGSDGNLIDSRTVSHAQFREQKEKIHEWEEKYRKAMIQIAQLDNEKQVLMYRVDLYQDRMEEQEERTAEYQRLAREKKHELDYQKRLYADLENVLSYHKAMLTQRDDIIAAHGFVFVGGELVDDEEAIAAGKEGAKKPNSAAILSQKAAAMLEKCGEGSLEGRLRKFAAEKEELREQVRKLKADLDSARGRGGFTSLEPFLDKHDSSHSSVKDYTEAGRAVRKELEGAKYDLDKSQEKVSNLENTVAQLEAQLKKYRESRNSTPSRHEYDYDANDYSSSSLRRSTSRSRATTPSSSNVFNGSSSGYGVSPIYETSRRSTTSVLSELPPSGSSASSSTFRDRSSLSSARDLRSDRSSASRTLASDRRGSTSRFK